MADKRKSIVLRFGIVYFIILFLFSLIIYRIVVLQFIEKDQWLALAAKNKKSDIRVRPNRGNIFACDGRMMASSIPTYYIYMDTRVPALHEKEGQLFKDNIDSVAKSLSGYFGDKSEAAYKAMIKKGYREKKGELMLYPKRITYAQLKDLKRMPLFRLGRNKSGLITKELLRRVKPFGSLASRTIGDIYAEESKGGKNGLELYFNKELEGTPGVSIRQKVANRWEETVQVEPVDGLDIVSTIDIDLQDMAEKALRDGVIKFGAAEGYAILMEANSGEIKAIVNLQRNSDSSYTENRNGCVANLTEPGSTFKVVSLMALLDEGKAKLSDTINTFNGRYQFENRTMTDHNANHGGYHKITLAQAIYASSNIGVSRIVDKVWGSNPSGYVDKLYEMKLNQPFHLEIPGTAAPNIRHPKDKSRYWSSTTLPWMSIGYETQIPPIYTLAFFNAIANNGKYIQPFFAKAIMKNGQIIKTFQTEVINPQICKPSTLKEVRSALLGVVEDKFGTGQNVKSDFVRIAGKSGTAQISQGKKGYRAGGVARHQVSFCGFFPYENPQYTCIVVMKEPSIGYPSGGHMSGSVFKEIAEQTMALKTKLTPDRLTKDTTDKSPFLPEIKPGRYKDTEVVMNNLHLSLIGGDANWIKPVTTDEKIESENLEISKNTVPDLQGFGAKDAMFLLSRLGLRVQMTGYGKVISQNIQPGTIVKKGQTIKITLD
ncbi:MAG: penicillin-binding protein [Paludibacter sp.]|nr:penicillin-binding protein [Paludibacter sp.]